ncbi:hypothetical protein [Vibrio sp. Hal054]|uniref:hypothetical protein n=1 Tax=Vibrio sp. Hal054 TaxID=3035158 RepID=UPI00301D184C
MNVLLKFLVAACISFIVTACNSGDGGNFATDAKTSVNTPARSVFGAEVYGFDSDKVLYGKFIIRMKMVSKPGVISSFFYTIMILGLVVYLGAKSILNLSESRKTFYKPTLLQVLLIRKFNLKIPLKLMI